MQIISEDISYTTPSGKVILKNVSLSLEEGETAALVGDNGSGKSTLLRILTGNLSSDEGSVNITDQCWFIPQHFGQFDSCTVAQVLQVEHKIEALRAIENGSTDPKHFDAVTGDWTIRERLRTALQQWGLTDLSPDTSFGLLSGGEKTRILLAGMDLHQPELVLMDEPTNHLDTSGREKLYQMIRKSNAGFLIVSHDRELLELCNPIFELSTLGLKRYGGSYSFYEEQKQIEREAIDRKIHHTKESIAEAKQKHREVMQRKQKINARGNKKARKEGLSKMAIHAAQNRAEESTSKLSDVHEQKIKEERRQLPELKQQQRKLKKIKIDLNNSSLHTGKILFKADRINYTCPGATSLWKQPLSFVINSGEHIRITGENGSGKTTLIQLLNGDLTPTTGTLKIQSEHRFMLNQEYGVIDREATVLQQAQASNQVLKSDHELKTLLHRYLFDEPVWDQPCHSLSGGEMMRLSLCCLTLQTEQPDTIILDEPTNNLDLRNIRILTDAISSYRGTLVVISHDKHFVNEINLNRTIEL
ncbi:ABC-F family ATP-binding cassette domain-containing protein [Rhodohalobacter sp. 614A]|uniref:ABC-F family ATP-binding cassette domain-containing protein n=1 Tax=Rhodohalobacter sp. 614A TaxID=2908649 RepID=UPI001F24ED6E|nr:ABC-F family ATP-binding cassette domain-containing protein [Rhodohalobacter sp. 614A]